MKTWIQVVVIGLILSFGATVPIFAAAGDFVILSLQDINDTTVLMGREGEFTNLIVTASGNQDTNWFSVTNGNAADLPAIPFQFRVLNLSLAGAGEVLPTVASDALRHCAQVSELVQLQPDRFRMVLRIDSSAASDFSFDAVSNWLDLRLWAPGGSFRCGLRNL